MFVDHGESSRAMDRPQWFACLDYLRPGDTLKVRRLDRLAGSECILIETLQDLETRQVNLVSLTELSIRAAEPHPIVRLGPTNRAEEHQRWCWPSTTGAPRHESRGRLVGLFPHAVGACLNPGGVVDDAGLDYGGGDL